LLDLLVTLRARGRFTVQEMAEEYGVSRRTMLRDLQALSAMGVPLAATPGPGGGYQLVYPHGMVALSLSVEEAISLILAYESFLAYLHSPFSPQSSMAITKLRAALAPDILREIERVRARVAMVTVERRYDAPLLADLLRAALDGVHLRISYASRRGSSERLIFPYGLYAGLGFWYCACFDYTRGRHAALRADRVLSLAREEGHEPPEPLTLREWLRRPAGGESMLRLQASITPHGMKTLDWSAFGESLRQDAAGGGQIDMPIPGTSLDYYARIFLPLGREATIQAPAALIALLREQARAILAHYAGMDGMQATI
jgi:predicted DNA-binding transcriptional regulator YafY